MAEGSQFLVVVQLADSTPGHLQQIVPELMELLARLSAVPMEQAFRSGTRDLFGYFIRSKKKAAQIKAQIESPGGASSLTRAEPILSGSDLVMVLELGQDHAAVQAFSRALTWLQRR